MTETPPPPPSPLSKPVTDAPPPPSYGPPVGYPPPVAVQRPNVPAGIASIGLGVALIGLFALPVQHLGRFQDIGFATYQSYASDIDGRAVDMVFGSSLWKFWWDLGLLLFCGLLVLAVAWLAALRSRAAGLAVAVVALLVAVGQSVAYSQTLGYLEIQSFRRNGDSMWHKPGLGIWVALLALVIALVGGVIGAAQRSAPRNSAIASPRA